VSYDASIQTLKYTEFSLLRKRTLAPPHQTVRYTVNRDKLWNAILLYLFLVQPCSLHLRAQGEATQKSSSLGQVQSIYKTGMESVQQGRLDAAVQTFEHGIRIDPRNVILLNAIGATYSLKGKRRTGPCYKSMALDERRSW